MSLVLGARLGCWISLRYGYCTGQGKMSLVLGARLGCWISQRYGYCTGQGKMSLVLGARLGCWISPRDGPFSLGMHLETYEPFISLIFKFLFGLQCTVDD
jgi:uncharacterized protein YneF (UPF0154 family)